MELKDFIKRAIIEIVQAVDESGADLKRGITLISSKNKRIIEFDVAVTVEESKGKRGGAEIKVLTFLRGGGQAVKELRNATVSRVSFGVDIGKAKAIEEIAEAAMKSVQKK